MRNSFLLESDFREEKLEFPSYQQLIEVALQTYLSRNEKKAMDMQLLTNSILQKLVDLKYAMANLRPLEFLEHISSQLPEIGEKSNNEFITSVIKTVAKGWKGSNEFYVLFDMKKGEYVFVDERIRTVLGIEPCQFNVRSISALQEDCPLYYPEDLSHVIRFALVAFMTIALPCVKWNSFKAHYTARYRIGTTMSSYPYLRKKGHVVISKMCYIFYHPEDKLPSIPRYHIDRYYVYTNDDIEHPTCGFVSDFDQSILLNKLHYLFNAYLTDVPLRFVCMLDERRVSDRNKAVANAMNVRLKAAKNWDNEFFSDIQIANCFAKTIRNKIENTINAMDPFFQLEQKRISSDQEAVYFATRMGLLPMRENIKNDIYQSIRKIY